MLLGEDSKFYSEVQAYSVSLSPLLTVQSGPKQRKVKFSISGKGYEYLQR